MILIGIDDTDMPETRGTGHLARRIADDLATVADVLGIIRHQLLIDPQIPYTAKNSSASLLLADASIEIDGLVERVSDLMRGEFVQGSDPGLAIAEGFTGQAIIDFGLRTKKEVVTQDEALSLAGQHGIVLQGLGGTIGGVIGALASVGLASYGSDGRYIQVANIRELELPCAVADIHRAGLTTIRTLDGEAVLSGTVHGKNIRPARRDHQPILFVEPLGDDNWQVLKLD